MTKFNIQHLNYQVFIFPKKSPSIYIFTQIYKQFKNNINIQQEQIYT